MNRRSALKLILATATAPFYVPAERLMRVKPIVVPVAPTRCRHWIVTGIDQFRRTVTVDTFDFCHEHEAAREIDFTDWFSWREENAERIYISRTMAAGLIAPDLT